MFNRYVYLAMILCSFCVHINAEVCLDNEKKVNADKPNPTKTKIGKEDLWLCTYKGKKCYYNTKKSGNHYKLHDDKNVSDKDCPDKIF